MANFMDQWIDRLEGSIQGELPIEKSLERVAVNLLAALEEKKDGFVLFAGTAGGEEIEGICQKIEKLLVKKGIHCVAAGNVLEDAGTISLAGQCCGVVLVEKQGRAIYPVLEQEITAFRDLKKEILGFVLVRK